MGLGPPACDSCRVWLKLDEVSGWYCPVCNRDNRNGGYRHLGENYNPDDSIIPLLRFMKGKSPRPDK